MGMARQLPTRTVTLMFQLKSDGPDKSSDELDEAGSITA